ncbi:MAG: hypothetical protein QNJ65_18905 [Xenococcaceae cyanobacterium MO_234.B1]|nr:hypothetical protein [Xenococcaceae cyanobacterium MO_234.B1]
MNLYLLAIALIANILWSFFPVSVTPPSNERGLQALEFDSRDSPSGACGALAGALIFNL